VTIVLFVVELFFTFAGETRMRRQHLAVGVNPWAVRPALREIRASRFFEGNQMSKYKANSWGWGRNRMASTSRVRL
jgi:hypothetical protein